MSTNNTQAPTTPWDNATAGDKSKGAAYIAAHPEEFGFVWGSGPIGKGVGSKYVELRSACPWIDVTPELVYVFIKTWGAAVTSQKLRGTSIKVGCDRVNRDAIGKDHSVKDETLKEKIVSSILMGVITRSVGTPVTKYVVAGQVFTSQADADKFTANAERIRQLEAAGAFLAMAAENNIDSTVARSMAMAQYPLAFATAFEEQNENDDEENDSE